MTCTHSRDDYVSEVGPASDAGCVIKCGKTIVEGGDEDGMFLIVS